MSKQRKQEQEGKGKEILYQKKEKEIGVFRKTEFCKEGQEQSKETDQGLILDNSNYQKGQPYID